jgi:DNA gyrase subunit A
MSVIISRALPDARDGLKPSQRRILFAMHDLSLFPNRQHRKCAKICGDTSGNYHPHGEAVIYPTLVHMAQPWAMRETLVDGQGNFGSVEGDPPAAMRYTEARMTHLGAALMTDMDKDTVDFVPNYDETRTEPTVFPSAFPNLLVNGGTGIAVGMATNIPPHNLGEVIDGICAQIDDPDIDLDGLMKYVKGPDFPTGCALLGLAGVRQYLETGRGSMKVRGKAGVEELKGNREQIVITEIPYNVNRATLVERIASLVNEKVLTDITAIRDESDENTRVVIELSATRIRRLSSTTSTSTPRWRPPSRRRCSRSITAVRSCSRSGKLTSPTSSIAGKWCYAGRATSCAKPKSVPRHSKATSSPWRISMSSSVSFADRRIAMKRV